MDTNNSEHLNDVLDLANRTSKQAKKYLELGGIHKDTYDHLMTQKEQAMNNIPYHTYPTLKRTLYDLIQVLEATVEDNRKNRKLLPNRK